MYTDKETLRKQYQDIIVIPIDTDKFNKAMTESIKEEVKKANGSTLVKLTANDEDFYGARGCFGVIKGTNIVIDDELCGDILKGKNPVVPIDIYHEIRNEQGKPKDFTFIELDPCVIAKPTLNELLSEYALPEIDLPTFMGSRFGYNSRIERNMLNLKKELTQLK